MKFPIKVAPQVAALKSVLFEIQVNKTDPEELAAISRNEAELSAAGKRPKQSIVKTQLAMYKKELNNTRLEIEHFKQALDLVSFIQKDCMNTISSALTDPSKTSREMVALKEMEETLPLWIAENEEETPPLCGAIQPHDYVAKFQFTAPAHEDCLALAATIGQPDCPLSAAVRPPFFLFHRDQRRI
ncbi:SAGA-associated factor 29 [Trichonephila clavipes]|uniref:SAGA-associated factor 29 n=1 Tax=Trichonephila clavipes TaxID=2585209 RepID=A0A8X6VDD8_TRICX|nr:SAGA-associated factor 29 [Trichonephila clavipes]